jgi:hypothetical protein
MTEGMFLCFNMLPSVGAPAFFNCYAIFVSPLCGLYVLGD